MRRYLASFNLANAYRDARAFFARRRGYEWKFALASLGVCCVIVAGFFADSTVEVPWKRPEIVYVKNWRLDRTDAEIVAQQKIDQAKKEIDDAKLKKLKDEKRAEFQRMKDKISPWL